MDQPKEPDAGPQVRFCERRGGVIHRAYSTAEPERRQSIPGASLILIVAPVRSLILIVAPHVLGQPEQDSLLHVHLRIHAHIIQFDRRAGLELRFPDEEDYAMISLADCIGLCGLSEEEVLALAEHEHIPEIVAAALGQHLLGQPDGCRRIGAMIADDVNSAAARGDQRHVEELMATLHQFVSMHPEALASLRAKACLNGVNRSVA